MLITFLGSFDPPHYGHLNTYLNAQKKFGGNIRICICTNNFKNGLLTIEERLYISQSLFPSKDIMVYRDKESITQLVRDSDKIVRGFRDRSDIEESMKLADFYAAEPIAHKFEFIKIDEKFTDISSSEIKLRFHDSGYIKRALNNTAVEILQSKKIVANV